MPPKKVSPQVETESRLMSIYEAATPEDRARVAELVTRAKSGVKAVGIVTITPGMAAHLFFDHNKQNRAWLAGWSLALSDTIQRGEFTFTNQGLGFLTSGMIGDGQYRLAAIALSGRAVEILIAFGLTEEAILSIDIGRQRQPADALHILEQTIATPEVKTQMLRTVFGYLAKAGDPSKVLRKGVRHTVQEVKQYDAMLEQAIQLANTSVVGIAKPTLPLREARIVAFLFLVTGWPPAVVGDYLTTFQTGQDHTGENSPFFVAAKLLERFAARGERSTLLGRIALTGKAFQLTQEGVKAVKATTLRDVMQPRNLPYPRYTLPT